MADALTPIPVVVDTEPGSRLAVLHTLYAALKPELDKLAARVEEIKEGLKTELRQAEPNAHSIEVRTDGVDQVYVLSHTEPTTLNGKLLKEHEPLLWLTYAVKGDRWELRAKK